MWGGAYLAIIAIAGTMTWSFAVREEAVPFAAAAAAGAWAIAALTPEIVVVGNETQTVGVGAAQWLWAGLAVLSMFALVGAVLGAYPASQADNMEAIDT